jgi:hypothetical protein
MLAQALERCRLRRFVKRQRPPLTRAHLGQVLAPMRRRLFIGEPVAIGRPPMPTDDGEACWQLPKEFDLTLGQRLGIHDPFRIPATSSNPKSVIIYASLPPSTMPSNLAFRQTAERTTTACDRPDERIQLDGKADGIGEQCVNASTVPV